MPVDRIKGDPELERAALEMDKIRDEMVAIALDRADDIIEARFDIELGSEEVLAVLGPSGVRKLLKDLQRRRGQLKERSIRKEIMRDSHWPHRARRFGDNREARAFNTLEDVDMFAWAAVRRMVKDNRLLVDAASAGTFATTGSFGAGATVFGAGTALGAITAFGAYLGRTPNPACELAEIERLREEYDVLYRPFAERRHALKTGRKVEKRVAKKKRKQGLRSSRADAARQVWKNRN